MIIYPYNYSLNIKKVMETEKKEKKINVLRVVLNVVKYAVTLLLGALGGSQI